MCVFGTVTSVQLLAAHWCYRPLVERRSTRILNTHGITARCEGLVIGVILSRNLLRARVGIAVTY